MLGVKRMPRPLSESRKPESRRKIAVLRGMRLRLIDSPPGFPGQPCSCRGGTRPGKVQSFVLLAARDDRFYECDHIERCDGRYISVAPLVDSGHHIRIKQ